MGRAGCISFWWKGMAERGKPKTGEADLWKAVTKDVKPLKGGPSHRLPPVPAPEPAAPAPAKAKKPKKAAPVSQAPARPAPPPAPPRRELSHGRAPDLDKRTLERLRRGQMPIEAEIDLHGHTLAEAHRVLNAFVLGHAAAGRRCLRVITGKGYFREGGGVLKTEVPRWLNEPPLLDQVLAFTHARRDDGGEGALYVLLRRKRPQAPGT